MIIGQMTGRSFKFCNDTKKDLEHLQNWLAERGLMSSINMENFTVEISGYVNGKWREDVNGNLFKLNE